MIRGVLVWFVKAYRLLLSPWLGAACRFTPTCSVYAIEALEVHGAAQGSYLTLKRLVRCQPFCAGGHDPVPSKGERSCDPTRPLFACLSPDKKSSP